MKKAVILFSGGLDSTTCVAIAKSQGFKVYGLTFDYGQKHSVEINLAKKIGKEFQLEEHKILKIGLNESWGSALTNEDIEVEDYKGDDLIPKTYVPARNTIFLAAAIGWAEVLGAYDIFFGANYIDYSGYPDCRPEYFQAFEVLANLATKAGVEGQKFKIHVPLLYLGKNEIIREGIKLGVDYSKTVSCYRANKEGYSCKTCDACVLRKNGFEQAGMKDPTLYFA